MDESTLKKLFTAAKQHSIQKTEEIIGNNSQSDINITNENGQNLAHIAAKYITPNCLAYLQYLLSKNIDLNAVDSELLTPLEYAELKGNLQAIALLKNANQNRLEHLLFE